MSKIIISTDSPADVPPEICEKYDIRVIPLHILLDGKCYEDGVTVSYTHLRAHET